MITNQVLAAATDNRLLEMSFWDTVLLVGILIAIWLGMRAGSSTGSGIIRATILVSIWAFVLFFPLMMVGSLFGAAAEKYERDQNTDETMSTSYQE